MKFNFGRAISAVAILLFAAFAGSAKATPTQNGITAVTDMHGPAIGEQFTELASGVFTYSKTDLSLPGPMPINVTRVYRSEDQTSGSWNNRAFGIGARLNYDIFVYTSGSNEYVSMPDSSYLTCTPSGSEYLCNSEPSGVWFGSTISGSTLTRPDGTVYSFDPASGLLLSITDRFGNSITISRGASGGSTESTTCQSNGGNGKIPQYYVGTVSSSNGRAVHFCYDDPTHNPTDITGIADNASPTIKKVTYTYNSGSTLATVTQANSTNAVTTYQYGQTPPNARGDVTTIIVNDSCPSSGGCGSPNQVFTYVAYMTDGLGTVLASISSQLPGNGYTYNYNSPGTYPASHVTVSLPDNATRDFHFDSAGYLTKDVRNVNAANPEYTFFDRGQQTVGQSAEFVGEVDEDDSSGTNVLRKTTYNYDTNAGTVKSVTLCPAPGQSATTCGSSTLTATWNYSYDSLNRLTKAVEPLAYNGVGTTYAYTGNSSMTVTDPLGRVTTVDYNGQGQPTSVTDPIGNPTTKIQYYSSGDVESVTDPIGNATTYVTDSDGRVSSVTSPLQEKTQYFHDAIDDVTEVIDPIGNVTCRTYDLIGELHSTTPPKGYISNGNSCPTYTSPSTYTTTIVRNPSLTKTTLTDPLGNQTVTNLDGMGRSTDYTDKRGVVTTYTYNKFGEVTEAFFNQSNKSAFSQEKVDMSNFDPLDRVGQITDSLLGNTNTFTYDSLDSVLSTSDSANSSVSYGYDSNGRRISMTPAWESAFNYGYDCADELISMSNNGTSLQSCSPSNYVANGGTSTQVGINYDADGNPAYRLVDGVQTLVTRDADERVKTQTFQAYPSLYSYGGLTYGYDADSHVIDKGGSLAVVNIPSAVPTAAYSTTDQVSSWNGVASTTDAASNIKTDPASGSSLTWTARNQVATVAGTSEAYDGLGRRESATEGSSHQNFNYDGSSMIAWAIPYVGSYNFLTLPGGGALAGTYSGIGTSGTFVPLIDASGSTIALVNAASTQSPPATTYSYDPSGNPTVTGGNYWPFQYHGIEKEPYDPGPYYYSGSGQLYNPQLVRSLSETGQTSSAGTGGPSPNQLAYGPGSQGNGSFGHWYVDNVLNPHPNLGGLPDVTVTFNEIPYVIPLGTIAQDIEEWVSFFEWLFGGSGAPPTPRQLLHGRHPLYPTILGVQNGLIPTQASGALPSEISSSPCNPPPLQAVIDNTAGGPGDEDWCIKRCSELALEQGIGRKEAPDQGMNFFRCVNQCMGTNDYPEWRPYFPKNTQNGSNNFQVPSISPWWVVIPLVPEIAEALEALGAAAAAGL